MSGKEQKQTQDGSESTSARMLRKARSFKDDIKSRIIRRTPSQSRPNSPSPQKSPSKSLRPKSPAKNQPSAKPTIRGSGKELTRGRSFNDGQTSKAERRKLAHENDLEKIERERKKVEQALRYIQDVVNKQILQLLPGAVTVVLEIIMELNQLLSNYFANQDSSVLLSTFNHVYQSLAEMISWADDILIEGKESLDKEIASKKITAVQDSVTELLNLCSEKLEKCGSPTYLSKQSKASVRHTQSAEGANKRNSLPEIPLSPREVKILEETKNLSNCNNNISKSSDDILESDYVDIAEDCPPPKPPIPANWNLKTRGAKADAPPLPEKKRPQLKSDDSFSTSFGDTLAINCNAANHLMSWSPYGGTPLSQSPTGSTSSALSGSSEDLLSLDRSRPSSGMASPFRMRDSTYDNVIEHQQKTLQEFTQMTQKMNELTFSTKVQKSWMGQQTVVCGRQVWSGVNASGEPAMVGFKPPPLPDKLSIMQLKERIHSQYDNLMSVRSEFPLEDGKVHVQTNMKTSHSAMAAFAKVEQHSGSAGTTVYKARYGSASQTFSSASSSSDTYSSTANSSTENLPHPPPLPPKQKHVEAYMQVFGPVEEPVPTLFSRHSVHAINFYQTRWYQHQLEIFNPFSTRSNTLSIMSGLSNRSSDVFSVASGSSGEECASPIPPTLPPPNLPPKQNKPLALEFHKNGGSEHMSQTSSGNSTGSDSHSDRYNRVSDPISSDSSTRHSSPPPDICKDVDSDFAEFSTLDDVDVTDQLIKKKEGDDGPGIRGGSVDALIVHATTTGKNDFMFQEAFLTSYRTFLTPKTLITKLLYRYNRFSRMSDVKKKKLSRNAFSLLVRVVDELCMEMDESVMRLLMGLVNQLLCDGELMLARILRKKVLEKSELKQTNEASIHQPLFSACPMYSKQYTLSNFKPEHFAEQMTYLDSELFKKIEIPEVLAWSQIHSEEQSPHLTKFTEHFNKMSYWVRTRILEQDDAHEREKYMRKFIKIMKHLRKLNNFNSYLAILSALDSAPVRRLEWQKQNMEALKEFCQLIDSSSSFRAYRQALADSEPPCIPYLGLVLQDLTFVHIGNPDYLPDGNINFVKRWQQFNILENMRRFKKSKYEFKKNSKILSYFNNFENCLSEDSLWQISEGIRPRGGAKKKVSTEKKS